MNLNSEFKEKGELAGFYKEGPLLSFMEKDSRSDAMRPKSFKDIMEKDHIKIKQAPNEGDENLLHVYSSKIKAKNFGFMEEEMKERTLALIFCVKHLNKKKINSHLYLYRGFCSFYEPEYVMLLDVGTEPLKGSISNLVHMMDLDPRLGGAGGEL